MRVWKFIGDDPLRGLSGKHRRGIVRAVFRGDAVDDPTDAARALAYIQHLQKGASARMWLRLSLGLALIPAVGLAERLATLARRTHHTVRWMPLVTVTIVLAVIGVVGYAFVRYRAAKARRAIPPNEALTSR